MEKVVSTNSEKSLPGMVLNLKKPVAYFDQFGRKHRYIIQQIVGAELLLHIAYLIKYKVLSPNVKITLSNGCIIPCSG